MPHREINDSAAFLPDIQSQRLCLEDALKSRNQSAMLHALQAVASARSLHKLSGDLALTMRDLTDLLAGENSLNEVQVAAVIERLLEAIAAAQAESILAKMTGKGRARGKTGRAMSPNQTPRQQT